jgi:DUF4097 and DUF4098 domain-containing protein YvlB
MRRLLYLPAVLVTVWTLGTTTLSMIDVAVNETTHRTERFATATGVVLDNDAGTVTVVGDRTEGVVVELRARQGILDPSASATLDAEGRVVVRTRCPLAVNLVCAVDVTVHVPQGMPVTGGSEASIQVTDVRGPVDVSTDNGSVKVAGADGPVRIRTDNGRIEVFDSTAEVDLRTDNGSIAVEGVDGRTASATTSNGRIRLAFSNAPERISATSSNGRIAIVLPGDAPAYAVSASTSLGSVDLAVRTDPAADRTISAATSNGSISITYR